MTMDVMGVCHSEPFGAVGAAGGDFWAVVSTSSGVVGGLTSRAMGGKFSEGFAYGAGAAILQAGISYAADEIQGQVEDTQETTSQNSETDSNVAMSGVHKLNEVAKSKPSGMSLHDYLKSIGVPEDKIPNIEAKFVEESKTLNPIHEKMVAIIEKNGVWDVISKVVPGEVVTGKDVMQFKSYMQKNLGAHIMGLGHEHIPTGTSYGALEGPSEMDRSYYYDIVKANPNFNSNALFVITEKNFYYFYPDTKTAINFRYIPW